MRTVILFFGRIPFGDCLNAKTKAKSVSAKKRWKSFKSKRGIMKGRDLCKIPPKSPKFPSRHLGDFS